jgi:hypothetical protein
MPQANNTYSMGSCPALFVSKQSGVSGHVPDPTKKGLTLLPHICYIRTDRINYSDGGHPEDCPGGVDLWPVQADGTGKSLRRINASLYGNDPNNWHANDPSPGSVNP